MDAGGLVGDHLSPESTVTSLLSASGRLRSSLWPLESSASFTYRDKVYDSASAALDAYITDFEHHRTSESLTGRLLLPPNEVPKLRKPRAATPRNKDVLRERLTERELDFLHLPVSSLHHRSNRDRLSMTTDELLSIPNDGSQPVTHTSAYIQGLLSGPAAPRHHNASHAGLAGSHCGSHCAPPTRTPRSSRCKGRTEEAVPAPAFDAACIHSFKCGASRRQGGAELCSALHLPHWLTSNKADMDCSGMSSVPDMDYPPWIEHCHLSRPPPASEPEPWDAPAPRTGAPSWVADLEREADAEQTPAQVGNQMLGELRLQFAEQISQLSTERRSCSLFTDSRMESLIQKADEVLSSLSQSCAANPVNSGAVSFVHEEAAADSTEAREEKAVQRGGAWQQPGPTEALKQMLFRLQAVEAELQRQQQQVPAAPLQTAGGQLCDDEDPKLQSFPGRPSLQRALHHLTRLKLLVQEPAQKCRQEEEEEEEDEGHCASPADGLLCSEQGAC